MFFMLCLFLVTVAMLIVTARTLHSRINDNVINVNSVTKRQDSELNTAFKRIKENSEMLNAMNSESPTTNNSINKDTIDDASTLLNMMKNMKKAQLLVRGK